MILDIDSICGAIDNNLAELIHTVITIIKIGIPILLIIFGMLDFAKGVIASKEDEIKKGQQMFIRRLISGVLVFFVITIVQFLIGLVDDKNDANESDIWNCANLILNGKIQNSSGNNNNNGNNNKPVNVLHEAEDGLQCYTERATIEYNTCKNNNPSENNTNTTVCGTIFRDKCMYQGEILWKNAGTYEENVVNKIEWYNESMFEDIETIKQVYYDCVKSGLSEEHCKGYFKGFYKVN